MKTIKLLTLLLSVTLFLTLGSALSANESETKFSQDKRANTKSTVNIFGNIPFTPKNDVNWTRKSYNQNYTKGQISTH